MTVRWGILGASNFARQHMGPAIHAASGAKLAALATSNPDKAAGFQAFCPDIKVHASYDALLNDPAIDVVYGAYQRGFYRTALELAKIRATEKNDPVAMTMLGELYSSTPGIRRDYGKAIEWYKRAVALGDREAMFALAMLYISGRNGEPDRDAGAKLLASSAKLGEPKAAYNLALLYLDGNVLPRDVKRAAELLRESADVGNADAQYALSGFYKAGNGVEKDLAKSVRLLQAAAVAGNVAAEVEYAIALFNGTGTTRNRPAAISLLRKAARQNNPIAQNRLARVLVLGDSVPVDKIEGLKWHVIAKTAGKGDLMLDEALAQLSPEDRAKVDAAAAKWLDVGALTGAKATSP